MSENYPKLAQGQAVPATPEDLERDAVGITNPNLHRRIDDTPLDIYFGALELTTQDGYTLITQNNEVILINHGLPDHVHINNRYSLSVSGVSSYRTVDRVTHSEESNDSEIP